MKVGSTWYCITKACIQPAGTDGCDIAQTGHRALISHKVHQPMASSTLLAPTRNSSRCGASARRRRAGAGRVVSLGIAMPPCCGRGVISAMI